MTLQPRWGGKGTLVFTLNERPCSISVEERQVGHCDVATLLGRGQPRTDGGGRARPGAMHCRQVAGFWVPLGADSGAFSDGRSVVCGD